MHEINLKSAIKFGSTGEGGGKKKIITVTEFRRRRRRLPVNASFNWRSSNNEHRQRAASLFSSLFCGNCPHRAHFCLLSSLPTVSVLKTFDIINSIVRSA